MKLNHFEIISGLQDLLKEDFDKLKIEATPNGLKILIRIQDAKAKTSTDNLYKLTEAALKYLNISFEKYDDIFLLRIGFFIHED